MRVADPCAGIRNVDRPATLDTPALQDIINQLVERSARRLNETFAALSHPTRRSLLERLATGEATVTELAAPYSISLAAVSKHLQVLEQAGLVERRVHGRVHHLTLRARPMEEATRWLARYRRFWTLSLDALEALAAETETEG